ncbi:hypothetical protein SKAU_G00094740 [Synaphobranchus kaupii]|uniref:Gypsy retrotransposon integrase-like protein 1 n=1 Tax=Synaphobranchus kaupii TaxID=118154 RepID=A0A9Q1FXE8_SYNKA|nr:hypothetical protein SKAU_G00094740 [Synaphobranchus kaupii]
MERALLREIGELERSIESYLAQLELAAQLGGWTPEHFCEPSRQSGYVTTDGAVRRTPPREPTLLNQVHTPVPKPSPALPAPVAKIPATSAEASTSAFEKATEHKSHPRVGRLGKARVLHNGGPQLPGAWTPTATPLTSVTGAKMVMRRKKEVKVTVSGQEVSHEFWLADIADSCIIGLDLQKHWVACVDVSRASITLGMETVALQSGPTQSPARRAHYLATTARPASKLLQLATAPKPPSLTTVPQPDHSLAHHHQPATQQPPAQPKSALPAETTAAVHALWQRSSSGLDHQQRQQLKSLLDGNTDLFAVRDEDCTQTELVQHTINTAQPIRLRPHRMSPAKRLLAEEKPGPGKAERNYCVTRRELLAVVRALHHFRPYVQGSIFLLRTDHASFTWLLNFKDPEGQVACWLEQLQGYDFEIRHRAGRLHGNADALSRRPCAAQECRYCSCQEERDQVSPDVAVVQASGDAEGWLLLTPMELREAQEADSTLGKVRGWLEAGQHPERSVVSAESPELKSYYSLYSSLVQRDGLLYRRWQAPGRGSGILQLLVPQALRPDVLRLVHGSVGAGHFGNNKTLHRLRGKFHWPGCRHDIKLHVHWCDSCTAQKGPNQRSRAPLQQHLVGAPMERVGVDVLGPFPVTDSGNHYILVAMDYFTKWPEAFAVPDQSAATMAERLVEEMFTRFGAPAELHSDQGCNFESQLLVEVCKRLGVTKTRTTPLHPQSDGLVERFNRTLATQLAILASQHQRDWDRHLPLVLWAYRSAVQESSQLTPAALMFGRELRTPMDLVFGAPPEPEEPSRTREEYYHRLRDRLLVAHDFARKAQTSAGFKQIPTPRTIAPLY